MPISSSPALPTGSGGTFREDNICGISNWGVFNCLGVACDNTYVFFLMKGSSASVGDGTHNHFLFRCPIASWAMANMTLLGAFTSVTPAGNYGDMAMRADGLIVCRTTEGDVWKFNPNNSYTPEYLGYSGSGQPSAAIFGGCFDPNDDNVFYHAGYNVPLRAYHLSRGDLNRMPVDPLLTMNSTPDKMLIGAANWDLNADARGIVKYNPRTNMVYNVMGFRWLAGQQAGAGHGDHTSDVSARAQVEFVKDVVQASDGYVYFSALLASGFRLGKITPDLLTVSFFATSISSSCLAITPDSSALFLGSGEAVYKCT